MADPVFIQLPFGPGLDKETGTMVVKPNTMQDLRNVYHHEGSLTVREGTEKTNSFSDGTAGWTQSGISVGTGDDATHILAGIAIRSERAGIVVSWEETYKRVAIWRVNALGEESVFIGFWPFRSDPYGNVASAGDFVWSGQSEPPKIVLAEMYGQVFFAHDTYYDSFRADTYRYDPWGLIEGTARLGPLTSDIQNTGHPQVLRFRGVVRHLHYLFGWGWGGDGTTRPELVRVSLPGEPTKFDPSHYFIAGDRRDPVVACQPARQTLLVSKETETYQIIGYSRANFGIRPYDNLYGALASRLMTSVSGTVYVWSSEGPMAGGDVGPFEKIWLPLDLDGFEPATLVERTDFKEGWSDYIDEVELVIFTFGRRVYVLSVRNPADPRWTYWELGKKAFCGFRLYGGEGVGGVPTGWADGITIAYGVEGCGTYPTYTLTVDNNEQTPTDLMEVYHRPMGPFWLDDILTDPLYVDSTGDSVPDGWEFDENSAPTTTRAVYDGSVAAYNLALFNKTTPTTTAYWIELLWVTGAVVVGDNYRFEMDCYTPGPDEQVYSNGPWRLECQFYDVGDSPVGSLQSRTLRNPVFQRSYLEVTAPATATYAKVGIKGYIKSVGQQIEAFFRNPSWREQDVDPGAWVAAGSPVLVSPEATQTLPPITVTQPGMDYEFAVRYINIGLQATPGYEDTTDPGAWPIDSRGTALTEMDAPDWAAAGKWVSDAVGRYFEMVPGCGLSQFKYFNRDLEVYEDDALLTTMHQGEVQWFRQLRVADGGNTFQYKMRYIGPDQNSPFGPSISLYAGEVSTRLPPEITLLEPVSLMFAYWIKIQLTAEYYDRYGTQEQVGVQIQDNYDPKGGGGLLPSGEWNTVWVSTLTSLGPNVPGATFPPADIVGKDRKADGLTLNVRVREFYEPYPAFGSNPNETFTPYDVSPWSEIKTVTI
jgi:hypothetical protein